MLKWAALALGLLLFVNGIFTRTYGYADPENYCFQMDLIDFVGCSGSSLMPQAVMWLTILAGAALLLSSLIWAYRGRRQKQ
nr:hypothetical protein [uncultured Devosia sp.]